MFAWEGTDPPQLFGSARACTFLVPFYASNLSAMDEEQQPRIVICSRCGYHFVPVGMPPQACEVCSLLGQMRALLNLNVLNAPERQAVLTILAGLHRLVEALVAAHE